jgi:hypothetical protein
MTANTRGITPSPLHPFLNLLTDDKRKKVHHEALSDILAVFRNAGMTHYNISHIDDPERDPDLPIKIGSHMYDLAFPKDKNTIVLLEVKILKVEKSPPGAPTNGNRNP